MEPQWSRGCYMPGDKHHREECDVTRRVSFVGCRWTKGPRVTTRAAVAGVQRIAGRAKENE